MLEFKLLLMNIHKTIFFFEHLPVRRFSTFFDFHRLIEITGNFFRSFARCVLFILLLLLFCYYSNYREILEMDTGFLTVRQVTIDRVKNAGVESFESKKI